MEFSGIDPDVIKRVEGNGKRVQYYICNDN
jgi:hypothetical protein